MLFRSPLFSRPLLGYGPGNSGEALGYYQPGGLLTVDTYIITLLLDYGIIGFLLFTAALLSMLVIIIRLSLLPGNHRYASTTALAAALTAFTVIRLVLSQQDNHTFLFMLFGLFFVQVYLVRSSVSAERPTAGSVSAWRLQTQS